MAAKSLIGTGVLFTDRRDFYIKPNVYAELWPSVAPFTTIMNSKSVNTNLADPLFKMFEHRNPWIDQHFDINGGSEGTIGDDDTGRDQITVDGVVGLAAVDSSWVGLVFEVWNSALTTRKGVAVVTAVSGSDITAKCLVPGGQIVLANDDRCYIIGTAQGEGSSAPEAWSDELRVVWGSCQLIEVPVEVTGTLYRAALRGATNDLARLRMQKLQEFTMLREKTHLFGDSLLGTNLDPLSADTFGDTAGTHTRRTATGSLPIRTAMGLLTAIERYGNTSGDYQNVFTITEGSYDYGNFVDDMEKVFQYYPEDGVKYALCGPGAMSYWSKVADAGFAGNSGWKVQLGSKTSSLGFSVKMLETPHGVLALVPTPALRGPRNKYMVVISDSNLQLMQYEPAQYKTNIKTDNAYKGVKDTNVVDEGLGMTLIESHHMFKIQ